LHKDTVSGNVTLRFKKLVQLSAALDNYELIVDKQLRGKVKELLSKNMDKKQILSSFKTMDNRLENKDISKVEIYEFNNENVASRVKLDDSFTAEKIQSITDSGIKEILIKHLNSGKYQDKKDESGKLISPETLAFSSDGIDELNRNIKELNGGKFHQPIYKVRTFEPRGNKFQVGQTGNKTAKFVEAAKGTNLFFAIYKDEKGKRNYETIPLNIVIERQKQGLTPVPEANEKGDKLLFYLSPNDIVYIPNAEEQETPHSGMFDKLQVDQIGKLYKIVSFTGNRLYAIPCFVAISIVDKVEFTQLNKVEFDVQFKKSIKENCWKINVNRLGDIRDVFAY